MGVYEFQMVLASVVYFIATIYGQMVTNVSYFDKTKLQMNLKIEYIL